MTDLNERFAAMLEDEPTPPYDLDRVVAGGRRALRRRTTLATVAGTAGAAAVTAAIVVPLASAAPGGSPNTVAVLSSASPAPTCHTYWALRHNGVPSKLYFTDVLKHAHPKPGDILRVKQLYRKKLTGLRTCEKPTKNGGLPASPDPSKTPTPPAYNYTADPQTIASGFATELAKQVDALGLSIIYSRPFAQESSTLENGHPTYYAGNVDVQLPDGPADIGVQVTHAVTTPVPFDRPCNAPDCTETKLPDEGVEEITHIHSGSGGAMVIAVEIHHADGLVVEAQESNYAFGPEATRARSSQPLTIDQLTQLAEDPAFAF
jgi:hypothetical protein